MILGLVFLTSLMAFIVGWLFWQTLHVRPWQAQCAVPAASFAGGFAARKTGLWVFLGVATSLFVLFVSAYAMRLGFADWSPIPRPRLLMLNTAMLVGASLAMAWSVRASRRGDVGSLRHGMVMAGVLTFGFLAGQLAVWKQLNDSAYVVTSGAAAAFFYLFTAVHGLHVVGGLVAWARAMSRTWREPDPKEDRLSVELCATYWHYLLGVWAVLYALIVSEDLGLAICSSSPL
jgi:cytochrome c oxidase subunit 3